MRFAAPACLTNLPSPATCNYLAKCPLWVTSRSSGRRSGMSAKFINDQSGIAANSQLFDHQVGAAEQRQRYGKTECVGGFQIDNQFDLGSLLDWKISRLLPLEDPAGVCSEQTVRLLEIGSVAHESANDWKLAERIYGWHSMAGRQLDEPIAPKADIAPYSITSSASNCIELGIVSLSVLAVPRLMTNSNLVGCSTGMSPGFSPLRIRAT